MDDAQVQDGALRVARSPNPQSEELISRTDTMKTKVEQLEQCEPSGHPGPGVFSPAEAAGN